jgi:superfamily II DNA or RNA helicase
MPRGVYSGYKCIGDDEKKFVPQEHQVKTMEYFIASPHRGLLLFHKLGSGKTCTAVMIADRMLNEKKVERVYVLSPGSLRDTWISEYCKVCGESSEFIQKKFTFITYNYDVYNNLPQTFDGSLVIIDEVHNVINGVKNFSKNATEIYNKLLNSHRCRILALSGTPIFNYIYEFAILGRLLKDLPPLDPRGFPNIIDGKSLSPTLFEQSLFREELDGTYIPLNPSKVKEIFSGIISYYPGNKKNLPELIDMPPIMCEMSEEQEKKYWPVYDLEMKLIYIPPDEELRLADPIQFQQDDAMRIMAKKHVLSRGVSNFYYPLELRIKKDDIEPAGWVSKEILKDNFLLKHSPKFTALIVNIVKNINSKHVIFSFFKEKSGVELLHSLFKLSGISSEIFSGSVEKNRRSKIIQKFNAKDNMRGEKIRVLLITEAGAEGISLFNVRHFHVLESSTRPSKILQAIGRASRYNSHKDLPPEERNVKVWKYFSVSSKKFTVTVKSFYEKKDGTKGEISNTYGGEGSLSKCIDEELFMDGERVMKRIRSFTQMLIDNSVLKLSLEAPNDYEYFSE